MLEPEKELPYIRQCIQTADHYPLQVRFYTPEQINGGVFLVPAMGVTQQFYQPFASWLSQQGFLVATFDYRGIGESRITSLKGFKADIETWATQDASAVLAALVKQLDGKPLIWLGHSLGGQIIPLVYGFEQASKIITVAAGNGYWKLNAPQLKRKARLFWHGIVPLVLPLFGYFPGKRLGMVGDLPAGVMQQWKQWCLHPHYAVNTLERLKRYATVTQPFNVFYFTDDEMLSPQSVESMCGFYRHAAKNLQLINPHIIGVDRIGHMGFFRVEMKEVLWETVLKAALI